MSFQLRKVGSDVKLQRKRRSVMTERKLVKTA